jgi:hypothetical protein
MEKRLANAKTARSIYWPGCAFPAWVVDPKLWNNHAFSETRVFYHMRNKLEDVKKLCLQREPCNIGMRRLYNQDKMEEVFGWRKGAYTAGSPNFAMYCKATIYTEERGFFNAHVVNLIGCALDSMDQPDYQVYTTKESVIRFYQGMWTLALEAVRHLGKKKFQIYNVGGGAFSGLYGSSFVKEIFEPAFLPLLPEFEAAGIEILGYDFATSRFTGGFIPECLNGLTAEELDEIVFVNAWDPWSLIGNGNERDGSLDGWWGRCSNMAVLGWLQTNPEMQFVGI